jgi:hypothetical protein
MLVPDVTHLRKAIVEKHKYHHKQGYIKKQREVDQQIWQAKRKYKNKIEELFRDNQSRDAWRGLKVLTGMQSK